MNQYQKQKKKWFEEGYKAGLNDALISIHKLLDKDLEDGQSSGSSHKGINAEEETAQ